MSRPYFRIIVTAFPDIEYTRGLHQEKLINYALYKQPWLNKEVTEEIINSYVPDFEINHTNTSSTIKGHDYVLTTTLCCTDKDEEAGEYK